MTPFSALHRPRRVLAIIIAMIVPILIAAAFTTTLADPQRHTGSVVAAVVNNDEPVELDGQLVPLGRQLAAALVEGQGLENTAAEATYEWVMTNADLARAGLESGEYGAVVTIPAEFSAAATSTADPDGDPQQALIQVSSSPRARLADELMTRNIVRAAMASLGSELTGSYLENIFLGFNTLGEELGEASGGVQALADGAAQLADGTDELAGGTQQLADGAGALATGTGELVAGARALAHGGTELAGGTSELAGGAGDLAAGLGQLADGSSALAGGTSELHAGVSGLRAGTQELAMGADQLAGGAGDLAGGASELAGGLEQFSTGLGQLSGGAQELAGGLGQLNDAVSVVPEYLEQIDAGLTDGAEQVREFAGRLGSASGTIEEIIHLVCEADEGGEACEALLDFLGDREDLDAFLQQASAGLLQLAQGMEDAAADGALGQLEELVTGIEQLATGANELADGLEQARGASADLTGGANALAEGNAELARGLEGLAGGAGQLDSGVGQLQAGAGELDRGARELAAGTGGAAGGARDLAGGAGELAAGTRGLAQGAQDLAAGTGDVAAGTRDLADGAGELASGTGELAEGAREVAGGTSELADGLDEAADAIPNYPDGTRQTLAEVIADPIALSDPGSAGFRWLAFFSMVALWAGGLWLQAAYPAIAAGARTSTRSATNLTLRSLQVPTVIAAGQGVAVSILVALLTDIPASTGLGLGVLAALASVVFMVVQRGLVATLGWAGVALTVLIAVFAIATALTSAMPAFADTIVSWLPIGPAISATQVLEASMSGIAGPILGLLAWGAAGLVAVLLATRRAQSR